MNLDPNNIRAFRFSKTLLRSLRTARRQPGEVIMMMIRKGLTGKPTIKFSTIQPFDTSTYKKKYFDANGYLALRNARIGNYDAPANTSVLSEIKLENYKNSTEYDRFDLSTRTGWTRSYNAGVSGGSEPFQLFDGHRPRYEASRKRKCYFAAVRMFMKDSGKITFSR